MEISIEYISGLFDGEGHIIIWKDSRRNNNYYLRIGITSTNESILVKIRNFLDAGSIIQCSSSNTKHKDAFHWRANSGACDILIRLIPYLHIKKEQALLAIEFSYIKLNRNIEVGITNKLSPEIASSLDNIYKKMRILNKRGKD